MAPAALADEARAAAKEAAELRGQLALLRARDLAAQATAAPSGAPMLVSSLEGVAAKDLSVGARVPYRL